MEQQIGSYQDIFAMLVIQLHTRLIDKRTASYFNEFFNLNWQGTCTYMIYRD